jgi:hypothetical protein
VSTGNISTVAGNGTAGYSGDGGAATGAELNFPFGVAVDSAGNIYITDTGNNRIRKVDVSASSLVFATATSVGSTDTTDGTQTVTVQNIGNAALTISALSYATDFPEAASVGTDCTSSTSLPTGESCTLSVDFSPLTVGSPLSESLVLTDDHLNVASATQSILLSGSSVASVPTLSFASIPTETYGNAPFTVSASSASSGAVTYAMVSGPATISGATVTLTGAGTVVLSASQVASGNYAATTVTTSFTVAATVPTLSFAAIPSETYGNAPFAVSASSASSGAVTYAVTSGPATISGATVTLTGAGTVV